MINDLLSLKAAIGRCRNRVREEFAHVPNTFAGDQPAQDAAILKILSACEAMQAPCQLLTHREHLGARQNTRKILMIVPTLQRGYATWPLPRLDAERPKFGLPRWSVGAIKLKDFEKVEAAFEHALRRVLIGGVGNAN